MSRVLVLVAVLGAAVIPAIAQPYWSEDFESYPLGSTLAGQGGWEIWYAGGGDAYISKLTDQYATQDGLFFIGSNVVHRLDQAAGIWMLQMWVYVPTSTSGAAYVIVMNRYGDPSVDSDSVRMRLDADLGIVSSEPEQAQAPLIRDRYVALGIGFDLNRDTLDIYYNGRAMSAGLAWSTHIDPAGSRALAAIDLYSPSMDDCRFDHLSLDHPVPGDVNCDHLVNAFDIDPLVQCLVSGVATPLCVSCMNADCNGDGLVNAFDIDAFVETIEP